MDFDSAIRQYYPNAKNMADFGKNMDSIVRKCGYEKNRVYIYLITCRDDTMGPFSKLILDKYKCHAFNGVYYAGLPHKYTETAPAYHHTPDSDIDDFDGNIDVIVGLVAPHTGVSKTGIIGSIKRRGKKGLHPSCGAINTVINAWKDKQELKFDDPEIQNVADALNQYRKDIEMAESHGQKMRLATEYIYKEAIQRAKELLENKRTIEEHKYDIIIVGGIHIDSDDCANNLLELRDAIHINVNGEQRIL